jgi:cysteinyl-tRNA synthetase
MSLASAPQIVRSGNHPAWRVPSQSEPTPKLVVRNSLTDTKEPLIPADGNTVRMYVCGPTVYSVSHMGHARTFLCFDILRRILEKYFRYNVLYQLNITDIDDKIILSARKNELVAQYRDANHGIDEVRKTLETAAKDAELKLITKKTKMESERPAEDSREFAEYETQLKQLDLKLEQLSTTSMNIKTATNVEELIAAGKDILADYLDEKLGHTISDKGIFEAHSRYYENEFLKDCKDLGIREPDVLTRVTEYVDEIVTFVARIIENEFAYESNGSVYFDTQKFRNVHDYPKLVPHAGSGATDAEIAEGEGALAGSAEEKKHRNDFALWKKSKPGEPRWDSPWGPGRPGWHIECSVMASAIHGSTLDIHGGGVDLKFPHHDNEIAQTEAHFKTDQWVNYFLHAGHLHIKGLKMAKSLKNFITIREALSKFTAKQIRIMFLLQQWDRPVNFSDQTLNEARDKESRINSFLARVNQVGRNFPIATSSQKWDHMDNKLADSIMAAQERVHEALCDNFDTPAAMESIESCIGAVNQYLIEQSLPKHPLLLRAKDFVTSILTVFGVIDGDDASGSTGSEQVEEIVGAFVKLRDRLREMASVSKNVDLMLLSDELRDEVFVNLGIKVVDGAKGTDTWGMANPADLKRELELRRQEKAAKELVKLENKKSVIEKEISKWFRCAQGKTEREILFPEFTEFDDEGLPVSADISASKRKAFKKDLEKFRKENSEFIAKGGLELLEKLQGDLDSINGQIKSVEM